MTESFPVIRSLTQLYSLLPDNERIILDILREITAESLPKYCREKLSFNVPYFYGKKGIAIIWPASVPRGGFKTGVLYGFWYGNLLKDKRQYLKHGTNKKVFYRIFQKPEEINQRALTELLFEASIIDSNWK